jgi:hypothetical protein
MVAWLSYIDFQIVSTPSRNITITTRAEAAGSQIGHEDKKYL